MAKCAQLILLCLHGPWFLWCSHEKIHQLSLLWSLNETLCTIYREACYPKFPSQQRSKSLSFSHWSPILNCWRSLYDRYQKVVYDFVALNLHTVRPAAEIFPQKRTPRSYTYSSRNFWRNRASSQQKCPSLAQSQSLSIRFSLYFRVNLAWNLLLCNCRRA